MRIVIQGSELTVMLKADRDLTTQEIVMGHQLSTGNFEALFVSDEETVDEYDIVTPSSTETKTRPVPEYVQVEVMCPTCGYQGRPTTRYGNTYTKCPSCDARLHNKPAADHFGEKDKAGNYYHAYELLRPRNGGLTQEEQELLEQMQSAD